MSTLINLIISLIMSVFLGQNMNEPKSTCYQNVDEIPLEVFHELKSRQHLLEC